MVRYENGVVRLTEIDDSETLEAGLAEIIVTHTNTGVIIEVFPKYYTDYYCTGRMEISFADLQRQIAEIESVKDIIESKLI
jgi:hypothetical protein